MYCRPVSCSAIAQLHPLMRSLCAVRFLRECDSLRLGTNRSHLLQLPAFEKVPRPTSDVCHGTMAVRLLSTNYYLDCPELQHSETRSRHIHFAQASCLQIGWAVSDIYMGKNSGPPPISAGTANSSGFKIANHFTPHVTEDAHQKNYQSSCTPKETALGGHALIKCHTVRFYCSAIFTCMLTGAFRQHGREILFYMMRGILTRPTHLYGNLYSQTRMQQQHPCCRDQHHV